MYAQAPPQPLALTDFSLDLSNKGYDTLKSILSTKSLFNRPLELTPLTGGITNSLLKGTDRNNSKFLIRAYGSGTSSIINRDREYATHLHLLSHGLAPELYARFQNGLIYGFIPGKPAHYTDLSNPALIPAISNRLAQWHSVLSASEIDSQIRKLSPHSKFSVNLWQILDNWLDIMPQGVLDYSTADLKKEIAWFKENYGQLGGPMVVSHCDLLAGNIILPEDTVLPPADDDELTYKPSVYGYKTTGLVNFIDYEYTNPAPRAFDIANHLSEWQGFDCRTDLIPEPVHSNRKLRFWCYHYLAATHHFKSSPCTDIEVEIDELISQLQNWWGMPGFYWSVWACIQSKISDIDFDYAEYAKSRLNEYFEWKKSFSQN